MIDWKATGDSKITPRFQSLMVPGRLMVPLTKRRSLFSMEKNETKQVNPQVTLAVEYLPVRKFTTVVTSEKWSNLM